MTVWSATCEDCGLEWCSDDEPEEDIPMRCPSCFSFEIGVDVEEEED